MTFFEILWLVVISMACGAISAWLWTRPNIAYYKELYECERNEKYELKREYNRRLDALGNALETETDYMAFCMPELGCGRTEPRTGSEELFDNVYE